MSVTNRNYASGSDTEMSATEDSPVLLTANEMLTIKHRTHSPLFTQLDEDEVISATQSSQKLVEVDVTLQQMPSNNNPNKSIDFLSQIDAGLDYPPPAAIVTRIPTERKLATGLPVNKPISKLQTDQTTDVEFLLTKLPQWQSESTLGEVYDVADLRKLLKHAGAKVSSSETKSSLLAKLLESLHTGCFNNAKKRDHSESMCTYRRDACKPIPIKQPKVVHLTGNTRAKSLPSSDPAPAVRGQMSALTNTSGLSGNVIPLPLKPKEMVVLFTPCEYTPSCGVLATMNEKLRRHLRTGHVEHNNNREHHKMYISEAGDSSGDASLLCSSGKEKYCAVRHDNCITRSSVFLLPSHYLRRRSAELTTKTNLQSHSPEPPELYLRYHHATEKIYEVVLYTPGWG